MNGLQTRINQSRLLALCFLTTVQPIQPMRSAPCVSALWSLFCSPFFLYAAPFSFCLFLLSALFGAGAVSLFSSFRKLSTFDFREMAEEAPELKRDSTMTVTAKVRERSKAREQRQILNPKVPCNAIESFLSLLFLRKEHSFLKNKEKFTKMRKRGHSKKNSRKSKRKMLRAN